MRQIQSFSIPGRALAGAVLAIALAANAAAATEKILHDFEAFPHGTNPQSALISDAQGNLYGVTAQGGLHGQGVVYELVRGSNGNWSQKVLHDFAGINVGVNDGAQPQGRLVFDAAGNLYGTTLYGGDPKCNDLVHGCGTVYKLTPHPGGRWTETVIHVFAANYRTDGQFPTAGLTFGKDGNLYGTAGGGADIVFQLKPSSAGGWVETIMHRFKVSDPGGAGPASEVVFDEAGNLYSTTTFGGDLTCGTSSDYTYHGCGAVFELTPTTVGTWTETVLYTFTGSQNWIGPTGRLLWDSAGNLYGPAVGVVYELQRSQQGQWIYSVIQNTSTDWDLAFDGAGNLYGENSFGNVCGNSQCGTVFELQHGASGWTMTTLYEFKPTGDGTFPWGGLLVDASGNVFGTTLFFGDLHNTGSVFELSPSSSGAWQENVLYKFPQMDGQSPVDLVADASGNLYGVASYGGSMYGSWGAAFKFSSLGDGRWQYQIIHNFVDTDGGIYPLSGLLPDSSGNLYGTTSLGGRTAAGWGTVYKLSPDSTGAWHETIIYAFGAYVGDGASPTRKLISDAAGNLYGTTQNDRDPASQWGTVFELSPNSDGTWTEKLLHIFAGAAVGDGAYPSSALVLDASGNLYGTTTGGGTGVCFEGYSCGVVFKLSPNSDGTWTEKVIYDFTSGTGGNTPGGPVTFDASGNLYGTAISGGDSVCNCGVVFELTPSASGAWPESVLHTFTGGSADGANPASVLTFDSAGNLYGTTYSGGGGPPICNSVYGAGCGTLFKLTPSVSGSWSESIVHSFGLSVGDGFGPTGVLLDPQGRLFGTASGGPGYNPGGTIFEITQ